MQEKINVLVTGIGGGVGQSIIKGLKLANAKAGARYNIIGVDADPLAAGLYRVNKSYLIPKANDATYIPQISNICRFEKVHAIIPGTDPEVAELADNRQKIEAETQAKIICSSSNAVNIGFDKWETYKFLSSNGFLTPKTSISQNADEILQTMHFPIIVKPRTGSASVGLFICINREELAHALSQLQDPLCQEYVYGKDWEQKNQDKKYLSRQTDEYSTEVFVDKNGKIVNAVTNWRTMKKGIPSKAIIDDFPEINECAKKVVQAMPGVFGPVNLQCRLTSEGPVFFEINTRFSGSTAVRCAAGFNGPHIILKNVIRNEPVRKIDLDYKKIVEIRWNNELYIKKEDYEKLKKQGNSCLKGEIIDYF